MFWNAIAILVTLNVRPNLSENPLGLIVYLSPLAGVILLLDPPWGPIVPGRGRSFGVTPKLRRGDTELLGTNLPDRESADTVAAKMMADLGR